MATDRQAQSQNDAEDRQRRRKASTDATALAGEYLDPEAALRAKANPSKLSSSEVLGLQRTVGNAAVGRMLDRAKRTRARTSQLSARSRTVRRETAIPPKTHDDEDEHDLRANAEAEPSRLRSANLPDVRRAYDVGSL